MSDCERELEAAHKEADGHCLRYKKCSGYPPMTLSERVRDLCIQIDNLQHWCAVEKQENARLLQEMGELRRYQTMYEGVSTLLDGALAELETLKGLPADGESP